MASTRSDKPRKKGYYRTPSTAWKPGQSGNPGGRPKALGEMRDLARQAAPRAIQRLVQLVEDDKTPGPVHVAASQVLLDRGFGRPETTVNVRKITSVRDLSDEELASIAAELPEC